MAVLDWIKNVGDFIETLPKAAAIYEYAGNGSIADIPADKRSFIRRKIGSPDFLAGGTFKPVTNEVALFSNAITQAIRADLEVATDPQTRSRFWWKTAAFNIAPKLAIFGALYALKDLDNDDRGTDDALARALQGITEYDLTNYIPIPLGTDSKGNSVYIRLPQDDSGRLLGGLVWKALQLARGDRDVLNIAAQVFDYTAGQVPSLSPAFQAVSDVAQFASGGRVYDPFRNRFLFTEDEAKARDWRTAKKFLGYEFQQLGGGIIWKFHPGDERPRHQTEAQKIFELPILSTIVGRWIKVTSFGEVENLRRTQGNVSAEEARLRLRERDAVSDALAAYQRLPSNQQTPNAIVELARGVTKDLYSGVSAGDQATQFRDILKKLRMGVVRGQSDPVVDAVMSATSNAQKSAILLKAGEGKSDEELREWLVRATREGVISEQLLRSVLIQRQQPAGTPR